MTKIDLSNPKPGAYVTTRDHRLPKPDRRLRGGWLSTDGVPAGTVVIVQVRAFSEDEEALWKRGLLEVTLELPGQYSVPGRAEILVGSEGPRAVGAERATQDYIMQIASDLHEHRDGVHALDWIEAGSSSRRWEAVLATLLRAGRVTEADIRVAMAQGDTDDARAFDAESFIDGWRRADAGEPLTEIGSRVRANRGGGDDTVVAANAGAHYASRCEGRADDAHVAAEAERWVAARHPRPTFGPTMLDQVRTLLGGAS